MAIFDEVHYLLSQSLSLTRRNELASILDLNGAAPHPPYTHLVALPASHAHDNPTIDLTVKLVTDRWVDRSIVMGKRQPEQYYSPDPAMIFSGVVACATDLSSADLEVLSAGITALGGQWRIGLTRDVTHLFALRTGSNKYNTALHFASQTHISIVTPHWFDDAVRLGRRIPETPYAWPDPPVLRPGMTLKLDDDSFATEGRRRKKPVGGTEAETGDCTNAPREGERVRVWSGRRILLSTSLELAGRSRSAIEARVQRAGGVIVPIAEDANEDEEEKAVDDCDVFVTRWRSGKSYFKAARASLLIGNLSWLFSVESSGTLHSPLDSLLWYPTPRGGIPDLSNCEISITNYTGAARDYLKRLIILIGAKFTPSMSQSNKVLVAGFQPSPKTIRALSWSIPVVNHTWIEDCFVEWRALTVGLERYIVYPPGLDFGKMLMTGHDGHSSSVSVQLLSGGAVPGGRGVGAVDIELEESRESEYRSRVHEGHDALGLSTVQEAHVNDTTVDEISMASLNDDVPTKSRALAPSQAGLVKKTPPSLRGKHGSVPTLMMASATGAFVDHVIELPADDEEEHAGDKRRVAANIKRRIRAPLTSSRATSQSVSRASSVDLSEIVKKVEVIIRHSGTGPGGSKEQGKAKDGNSMKGAGKQRAMPVQEAEDDDTSEPKSNLRPHSVHCRSEILISENKDKPGKQTPAQKGELRRQGAKAVILSSNSDSDSNAGRGESESESVSPRRPTGTGSTTPVKSRMKPNPRSRSKSRPGPVFSGDGGNEVAADTTRFGNQREEAAKPTRNGEVVTKEKEKERTAEGRKKIEKIAIRPQSPTCSPSPTSPNTKNSRTPKRRLSVLIPPMPKDYFSTPSMGRATGPEGGAKGDREHQNEKKGDVGATPGFRHNQLASAKSIRAVAAETSMSASKRGKPAPVKISNAVTAAMKSKIQPGAKTKPKPGASMKISKPGANDDDEDMNEGEKVNNTSMIVDSPVATTSRGGPRRSAANKAVTRLREEIMPDVIRFEEAQKQGKRRRSAGRESVTSMGMEDEERIGRGGKRRRVATDVEGEEEAEVEDVVLAPSTMTKPKPIDRRDKANGTITVGSDRDLDDRLAKNKLGESHEKKGACGAGSELATIRLMTTGVVLSDDVIKRLAKLGVQMTTKPTDCTHLVAKGIVRTEKFLCAMSVSPYVLTEEWADACAKNGKLLPEDDYLLSDAAAEQKWAFKFADAMARAKGPKGGSSLFKQMTFYVTPKVPIDAKLLKNVVSAGGGQVQITTTPTARILKGKANRYVVSCKEDKSIWRTLAQEGFKIYSHELVLRGALRQEIEWEREECLIAG